MNASSKKSNGQDQLSPEQERFQNLEKTLPTDPKERFDALSAVAVAAFKAGALDEAQTYANELLSEANRNRGDAFYGNGIYYGNFVNGLVALKRDNNLELAGDYLIAAGKTPGSPTLNSFGPNMLLAKELLARGDKDTVLEFLNLCRSFWKVDLGRLDQWSNAIQQGETPNFASNLNYD